jgi:hypothetical protein
MDSIEFREEVRKFVSEDGYRFETDEELLEHLKDKYGQWRKSVQRSIAHGKKQREEFQTLKRLGLIQKTAEGWKISER